MMKGELLMKPKNLHTVLVVALLLALLTNTTDAQPQSDDFTLATTAESWGSEAYYFAPVLHQSVLFWAATPGACLPGVEFPRPCQIRSRPANGGVQRILYDGSGSGSSIESNLAADNQYIYWIGSDYRIKRLAHSAMPTITPEPLAATTHTTTTLQFEVAVDANYLFWTESIHQTGSTVGRLYRMPKSGGTRELMQIYNQPLSDLRADGTGGAYFISPLFSRLLLHTVPGSSGFVTDTTGVPVGVVSYTLDTTHVYWAEKFSFLRIKHAPRSNISAVTTLEDRGTTGSPTAAAMAVDGTNIYWHETRSSFGPIYRRSLAGGAPEAITANLANAFWMDSNNRYLFWNNGEISRLPINASAWSLDMTINAASMEVIQVVQRPANDVPLVSGKETFVRVFPQIASSTPMRESISFWPSIELHGLRDGSVLPGSPLQPVVALGRQSISTTMPDRRLAEHGIWFRLPSDWTDGAVQLRAVLNARRIQPETSYANNEASRNVTFNRKSPICLDVRPVSTERGTTIASWRPGIGSFFRRAEQLLPTHDLRVLMRGGNPLRKPRWYLFESDPFGLSDTNADSGWMLFLLNLDTLFSSNLCTDGGTTIRTVMAQDFPQREVNGMQFGNSLLFFAFVSPSGGFAQNTPGGGVTLAHEIGHSFGRGHVNCGGPDGVDGSYPYPPCQLDNAGPNEQLGFDPQTRSLLLPEATGDLMSYAHRLPTALPRWPSDYTWRGIFNALGNRSMATSMHTPMSVGAASLLVTGFINGSTAEFRESYTLNEPLLSQVTTQLASMTEPSALYRIRAYAGTALLYDQPLQVSDVSDGNATSFMPFYQRIDTASQPSRIEIVRVSDSVQLGNLPASANSPNTTITAPTTGSAVGRSLSIAWNSNDPDGGLLHHMVRYSVDNGATWTVVASGLTDTSLTLDMASLPGGSSARVQVITTDGLNSTMATSAPFSVATIGPEVSIDTEPGMSFAQGEIITLRGRAYDAEDGFLSATQVQWQVLGQVNQSGDGEQLTLLNLPPGSYRVQLRATDSSGISTTANSTMTVVAKQVRDGAAPIVDGFCDDAGYTADHDPVILPINPGTAAASYAQVRFIRAGSFVYACFSGLALGSSSDQAATLRFDLNNSADAMSQVDDLVFSVQPDGLVSSGQGNGSGSEVFDSVPQGIQAAVSMGEASWSAEMQIDADQFGAWDRLIRMHATAGNTSVWPQTSTPTTPVSWGLTQLGTPIAYRIQLPLVVR
jgi:hypothetical protein